MEGRALIDTLLLLLLLVVVEPRVLTEANIWVESCRALVEVVRALMVVKRALVATFLGNTSKQQVEVYSILVIVIHDGLSPGGLNVIEATM